MGKKEFLESVINKTINYVHIWYLVASWASEVTEIVTQRSTEVCLCKGYSDLTSPTSNQIPNIHNTVSVVYDTLKNSFSRMHVHIV